MKSNQRPKDHVNLLRVLWAVMTKTSMKENIKWNAKKVSFY